MQKCTERGKKSRTCTIIQYVIQMVDVKATIADVIPAIADISFSLIV